MDWQSLNPDYLIIATASGSFVVGVLFTRLALRSENRAKLGEDRRDFLIRQLEADLRVAQRRLDEYSTQLETKSEAYDESMATVLDLNALLETRDGEVEHLRKEVKGAVKKTHELRRELTDRAEETLREHVRAEEARTELDIAIAGSDAIVSEFTRIQDDKKADTQEPDQADMLTDDFFVDESR